MEGKRGIVEGKKWKERKGREEIKRTNGRKNGTIEENKWKEIKGREN